MIKSQVYYFLTHTVVRSFLNSFNAGRGPASSPPRTLALRPLLLLFIITPDGSQTYSYTNTTQLYKSLKKTKQHRNNGLRSHVGPMRQPKERRGIGRFVRCMCALCRVKEGTVGVSSLSGISKCDSNYRQGPVTNIDQGLGLVSTKRTSLLGLGTRALGL